MYFFVLQIAFFFIKVCCNCFVFSSLISSHVIAESSTILANTYIDIDIDR